MVSDNKNQDTEKLVSTEGTEDNVSESSNKFFSVNSDENKKELEEYQKTASNFNKTHGATANETNMTHKQKKTFMGSASKFFKKLRESEKKENKAENIPIQSESSLANKIISLDHKVLVISGLIIVGLFGIATFWGLSSDNTIKSDNDKAKTSSKLGKDAVQGNHLVNVPRDYSSLAEEEAKKKAEADKERNKDFLHPKKTSDIMREPVKAPDVPSYEPRSNTVPDKVRDRHFREYENYLELQQKAKESPIRFELDK